ncbi:MAG: chemotaxis-specific protein-glutamate methyltransferase CheB [Bacteroidota bacterium]|nr:chemotaxis-specific protein-glutamate methyltransferase CheB [Bacteroidota bacterium]
MKPSETITKSPKRIKVLIVEDSTVMQELLVHILSGEEDLEIIGRVKNGYEAIEFIKKSVPDVITMDVNMPIMNGLVATRRIMETTPIPIIIVSDAINPSDVNATFKALEAGAVSIANKPKAYGSKFYFIYAKELCQKVRLMSEIKLVRRVPYAKNFQSAEEIVQSAAQFNKAKVEAAANASIIAIGASTGGPVVIEKILSSLPKGFPLPIVIVQHITSGFTLGFTEWLNITSSLPVLMAEDGMKIGQGICYIAPDGHHLKITRSGHFALSDEPPVFNLRPSVSYLFRSVAEVFGPSSIGILLTGMGRDGAEELKIMKDHGAITIAQDKDSSVVYGMPGEAVKINAARFVLSPEAIISFLIESAYN